MIRRILFFQDVSVLTGPHLLTASQFHDSPPLISASGVIIA